MAQTGIVLPQSFYDRPVVVVAKDLVGCILQHRLADGSVLAGRIVETEAYRHDDPASHAYRGPTARNTAMFGPAGHAYVYVIYGIHHCFNVVCGAPGVPDAVLVRALEPTDGMVTMWQNRFGSAGRSPDGRPGRFTERGARRARKVADLTSGPGKLCQALGIQKADIDRSSLQSGPLTIHQAADPPASVLASRRIGISRAPERLWRFSEKGNPFVSRK